MAQPIASAGYFHLTGTAAGTVQILNYPSNFNSFTIGTTTTGTVTFHDTGGTAQGTTATSPIVSYIGTLRDSRPMVGLKKGLIAVVSGTIDGLVGIG